MTSPRGNGHSAQRTAAERIRLTEEGLERLEGELRHIEGESIPDVGERIRAIRETTADVLESGDYGLAMDELAQLQARAAELRSMIGSGEVVHPSHARTGEVHLGSRVTLADDGRREVFRIVGAAEADVLRGDISEESPLGRSLLGRHAGDEVEWSSPAGLNRAKIVRIG